jgi:hypothetical protein
MPTRSRKRRIRRCSSTAVLRRIDNSAARRLSRHVVQALPEVGRDRHGFI